MIEKYRKKHGVIQVQYVLVDHHGMVLESDQSLFEVHAGQSISQLHYFFESLDFSKVGLQDERETISCINIEVEKNTYTIDLVLTKVEEGFLLAICDLSEHYENYQNIAQVRNESIIKGELTVLRNLELQERERFKNIFIQNFGHEIRNPLTHIIAITNIIAATELTREQQEMMGFLKESNTALKLLLEDILDLGVITSGKLKIVHKIFSLEKLVEYLKFTYTAKAKERNLKFEVHVDPRLPEFLEGDRLRLLQILTNLLDNAIKFTDDGKIAIDIVLNQIYAHQANVRFQIGDTGVGILNENHSAIFESFNQISALPQKAGSGLGLAIVKGLLEQMGASIKLKSTLNEGSLFYFDLNLKIPLHKALEPKASANNELRKNYLATIKERKYRILLVEDDERVQTVVYKILADTGLFYIDLVNDGARVIEQLSQTDYDIILMDIVLPNVSGDEVTRVIRDFPLKKIQRIPIIGLTANAFESKITSFLQSGMNTVVTKPFENDYLLKTIYRFLK